MSTQNEVTANGGGRQYGTKLTAKGAAALAACILEGTKLEITEIAVGDGGGAYYEPMSDQMALVHEVWRDEVLSCEKSVLNPNTMDIKGVIPSDAGGFVIREMGVFDAAGTLIGVCNTPDMEKTDAASGAGGKLDLIMHLVVTDADAVQVVIKSSLDAVSLEDVRELLKDKQDKLNGQEGQVPVFNKTASWRPSPWSSCWRTSRTRLPASPARSPCSTRKGSWKRRTIPAPLCSPSRRRTGARPRSGHRRSRRRGKKPPPMTAPWATRSPFPLRLINAKPGISVFMSSIRWMADTSPTPGRPSAPARTMTGSPVLSPCPAALPIPEKSFLSDDPPGRHLEGGEGMKKFLS